MLDYSMFGESKIYHITKENARGELHFRFWDITAYLLAGLLVFNCLTLLALGLEERLPDGKLLRWMAFALLLLAILGMIVYTWGTMAFVDSRIKEWSVAGGVVDYFFMLFISITHVIHGHIESSLNTRWPDWTSQVFVSMLILVILTIKLQLKRVLIAVPEPRMANDNIDECEKTVRANHILERTLRVAYTEASTTVPPLRGTETLVEEMLMDCL